MFGNVLAMFGDLRIPPEGQKVVEGLEVSCRFWRIQEDSGGFYNHLGDAKRIHEDSEGFRSIQEDSGRFRRIKEDSGGV